MAALSLWARLQFGANHQIALYHPAQASVESPRSGAGEAIIPPAFGTLLMQKSAQAKFRWR